MHAAPFSERRHQAGICRKASSHFSKIWLHNNTWNCIRSEKREGLEIVVTMTIHYATYRNCCGSLVFGSQLDMREKKKKTGSFLLTPPTPLCYWDQAEMLLSRELEIMMKKKNDYPTGLIRTSSLMSIWLDERHSWTPNHPSRPSLGERHQRGCLLFRLLDFTATDATTAFETRKAGLVVTARLCNRS